VRTALAHFAARPQGTNARLTADWISQTFGGVQVTKLTTAHIDVMNAWAMRYVPTTRHKRAQAIRQQLRYLIARHKAKPHLVDDVIRPAKPKPRNITATEAERVLLFNAAPPRLLCWLLMCSDLAIRSGTAATLGPQHYDKGAGTLTFTTKYQAVVRLPVTRTLAALFDRCTNPALPFVAQLEGEVGNQNITRQSPALMRPISPVVLNATYRRLKTRLGITRKLTPHDFRRTTARRVYNTTRDLRLVQALLGHSDLQSTLWYLQDSLTEVPVSTLELAKLNPLTEAKQ
jgi:integrase